MRKIIFKAGWLVALLIWSGCDSHSKIEELGPVDSYRVQSILRPLKEKTRRQIAALVPADCKQKIAPVKGLLWATGSGPYTLYLNERKILAGSALGQCRVELKPTDFLIADCKGAPGRNGFTLAFVSDDGKTRVATREGEWLQFYPPDLKRPWIYTETNHFAPCIKGTDQALSGAVTKGAGVECQATWSSFSPTEAYLMRILVEDDFIRQ